MKLLRTLYVISSILVISLGCSRKSGHTSNLRFTSPGAPSVLTMDVNSALSSSKFCYFLNITGPDIHASAGSCAPPQGINKGFIPPSTTVEFTLDKGTDRIVELFGYVAPVGEACDPGKSLGAVPLNRLFRMARKVGIDMSGDQTVVDLTSQFPGITQHFGIQGSLPVACYAGLPGIPVDPQDPVSPVQSSASYVIKTVQGSGASAASSASYKIKGVMTHVMH